jgi:beta-xylosidase
MRSLFPRREFAIVFVVTVLAACSVWTGSAAGGQSIRAASAPTTATLVYDKDFPDPSILVLGHTYFAYSTNSDGENVPLIESHDLLHWRAVGDVMSVLPAWASNGYIWSPSVSSAPAGGYQLFFSAFDQAEGVMCLGRATSQSPVGPFVDVSGAPFLCQVSEGGSIDPYLYRTGGNDYLVWKEDGESGQTQAILSAPLADDDSQLLGNPTELISATLDWERGVVERPALIDLSGVLYVYFSAGDWSTAHYAIGITTCSTPLGPCHSSTAQPSEISASAASGVGSPTFFAANGHTYIAFSAWTQGIVGNEHGHRALFLMLLNAEHA